MLSIEEPIELGTEISSSDEREHLTDNYCDSRAENDKTPEPTNRSSQINDLNSSMYVIK